MIRVIVPSLGCISGLYGVVLEEEGGEGELSFFFYSKFIPWKKIDSKEGHDTCKTSHRLVKASSCG